MGHDKKKAYLEKIRQRYRDACKKLKRQILDEFCAVCDYHRKHAIRLLNKPYRRRKSKTKKPGPKVIYDPAILQEPLQYFWLTADQMCSKKLKVAIALWMPYYEELFHIAPQVKNLLLTASPATLDRLLKPLRVTHKRKRLCGTKPGSLLKNQIPIKTDNWDVDKPGYVESDTVAHCGNSLAGDFVWSLTLTDICSTWTENRATWGKGSAGVLEQIQDIENSLPFPLLGFDCDNGSEFLNYHLIRYFSNRPKELMTQFTRSRPYHKDDNAHVEQKNWTHVRQLLGYDRIDNKAVLNLINDLYKNEWSLLQNHFYPSMKLTEKIRINSRYRKRYDKPKTPYDRLLAGKYLTAEAEQKLKEVHARINPFNLKQELEKKLKIIFRYIKVTPNVRHRI